MNIKKISRLAMLLALSAVLSIIESFIPLNGSIPGLKLGLANTVIVFVIYIYGFKDAFFLSLLRVFLIGLLRTGLFNISFFFSIGGAVLSVAMMSLAKKYTPLSVIGVSVLGAIFHNIGQVLIGIFLLNTLSILFYLPYLLVFATITGVVVGSVIDKTLKYYFTKEKYLQ